MGKDKPSPTKTSTDPKSMGDKSEDRSGNNQAEVKTEAAPEKRKKEGHTVLEEAVVKAKETNKSRTKKSDYAKISKDEIKPGMTIKVHQKIVDTNPKGEEKERVQIFAGMVLARKHGKEPGATITVRKISGGVGVEKIFPLAMPSLTKFELVRRFKVRQARPYYLRAYKKKLKELK